MIIVIMNMMILMLQATVKSLLVTAHQGSIINEIKERKEKTKTKAIQNKTTKMKKMKKMSNTNSKGSYEMNKEMKMRKDTEKQEC